MRQGLILLAHGARDAHWREPFEQLAKRIRLQRPGLAIRLAFLELMSPDVVTAGDELVNEGCDALVVVPIFLGQGGHVLRDIPALVSALRRRHPQIAVAQSAAAGENDGVLDALAAFCLGAFSATIPEK
jgi:sirohydrochlorin cobaltochelatase